MTLTDTTIDYATCPAIGAKERMLQDLNASGKTWIIGSYEYGGNGSDDKNDADAHACQGSQYTVQPPGRGHIEKDCGAFWGTRADAASCHVSSSDTYTLANTPDKQYLEDGDTRNFPHTNIIGTSPGNPYVNSGVAGGHNNWTRTCMKGHGAYFKTDPTSGRPTSQTAEYHKKSCCGFGTNSQSVNINYCHPDYCHDSSDRISEKCRDYLAELCGDIHMFKTSPHCKLPKDAYIEDKSTGQEVSDWERVVSQRYSKSLNPEDYKRLGERFCTYNNFNPDDDSHNSCLLWCGNNPSECAPKIQRYCKKVYDEANMGSMDNFIKSQKICACNWPPEFYDKLRHRYIHEWHVPEAAVPMNRRCFFKPCQEAVVGDTSDHSASTQYQECSPVNIVNCVQEINFNSRDMSLVDGGSFRFSPSQTQNCSMGMGTQEYTELAESYNSRFDSSTSSTTDTGGETETTTKKDEKLVAVVGAGLAIVFSLFIFFIFLRIMLKRRRNKLELELD